MPPHQASNSDPYDGMIDSQRERIPGQDSNGKMKHRRRIRRNGESFAECRPISADLDSTDELIVKMKDAGYSNDEVVAKLRDEGRINYDKKTVGTRYLRIKNAIADREEQRLDDELTDWHEGEVSYVISKSRPI
jgi:hypothetical protein